MALIPKPTTVEVKSEKPANIASKQRLGHDLLIKYAKRLGYNVTTKEHKFDLKNAKTKTLQTKTNLK